MNSLFSYAEINEELSDIFEGVILSSLFSIKPELQHPILIVINNVKPKSSENHL